MELNYEGRLLNVEMESTTNGIIDGNPDHTFHIDPDTEKVERFHKDPITNKTIRYFNSMGTVYFHNRPEGSAELYDGLHI